MDKLCKIRDLQRAVHQFESAFEKRYGICLNEGMTLCSLSKTGRLCPGELGELLGLTPSNTSKVLRSVEQKGLVTREHDHEHCTFSCDCRDCKQFTEKQHTK